MPSLAPEKSSSHLDRMHQRIRNTKTRILFQKPFRNLLFERQRLLRQRFDLVQEFGRDDDDGMMSGRDGEGGVFELQAWVCQALWSSISPSRSDLLVTLCQGALEIGVAGLSEYWGIVDLLVAFGE